MSAFPDSVYEFGDWLKAHPWVKRVKLPDAVFTDYMAQASANARITQEAGYINPVLTWRFKQAMIPAFAWSQREGLFPARTWRRQ